MAKKQKRILTKNKEIYTKFNSLYFMNEIVLSTASDAQLSKILKNINKDREVLIKEKVGDYILIRKKGPLNFSVYFQQN